MTSMTTICSLILALMIALSGGADVPAVPDMMDVITLRNLEFKADIFGEEINAQLPMEFQLSSAVGAQEAVLNFQINTEDGVLMPLYGRVVSDALQFAIGDSDKAYAVSEGMLREELALTDQDEAIFEALEDLLAAAVENGLMSGEADVYRSTAGVMRVMADQKGAATEETTLEYEGETYPAVKRSYALDQDEIRALADNPPAGLSEGDLLIVQGYAAVLDYFTAMSEFSQAMSGGLADEVQVNLTFSDNVRVEIVEAEIGGETYLRARQKFSGSETEYDIEYVVHGDRAEMRQVNIQESEDEGGNISRNSTDMEYIIEGPAAAPEALSMCMNVNSYAEFSETYAYENTVALTMTGGVTDGLWDVSGEMKTETASSLSGAAENSMEMRMAFSYIETPEQDGSKTGHFELTAEEEDMLGLYLAFDLNFAEVPYADAFAGRELLYLDEMDEAAMAALQDEWMNADEAAGAAFEAWAQGMEDALGISQTESGYIVFPDGSIEAIEETAPLAQQDSTHSSIRDSVRDNVLGEEASYVEDEYDEWDYDYEEEFSVISCSTWEEAQAAFNTELANFTPPEAYPLDKIEVFDGYSLCAYFGGDDGFTMDISYLGEQDTVQYSLTEDGKLVPSNQISVNCWQEGDFIYMVEFQMGDCSVYIYFSGEFTIDEIGALLAGFEF